MLRKLRDKIRLWRAARDRNRDRLAKIEEAIKASEDRRQHVAHRLETEQIKGEEAIREAHEEVAALHDKIERLRKERGEIRGRLRALVEKIQKAVRRAKRVRRQRRNTYSIEPGEPDWGGCRYYTDKAIATVDGDAVVTSRKRHETFGNPGSDHYWLNVLADAVDFGIASGEYLAQRIAASLGLGRVSQYTAYYTERDGHRYRHQFIWENHGTGPHFHYGVERVS